MAAFNFCLHTKGINLKRYVIPGSLQDLLLCFSVVIYTPVTACSLSPTEQFHLVSVTGHTPSRKLIVAKITFI